MKSTRFRPTLLVLLLATITATGCGAPRLDATSEETLKTSMDKMTSGMDDAAKKSLAADVTSIVMKDTLRKFLTKGTNKVDKVDKVDKLSLMKSVDGLTVAEIRAKADATRAELMKLDPAFPGK